VSTEPAAAQDGGADLEEFLNSWPTLVGEDLDVYLSLQDRINSAIGPKTFIEEIPKKSREPVRLYSSSRSAAIVTSEGRLEFWQNKANRHI